MGRLDAPFLGAADSAFFGARWAERPTEPQYVSICGKKEIRRREQAYGREYRFSGRTSEAKPVPLWLGPFLAWARYIDEGINGALVNWYDAANKDRISAHRDKDTELVEGAPIITVSLCAMRTFRMRGQGRIELDLQVQHGDCVVIPWDTNRRYNHEVPHFARDEGRRISVTMRALVT